MHFTRNVPTSCDSVRVEHKQQMKGPRPMTTNETLCALAATCPKMSLVCRWGVTGSSRNQAYMASVSHVEMLFIYHFADGCVYPRWPTCVLGLGAMLQSDLFVRQLLPNHVCFMWQTFKWHEETGSHTLLGQTALLDLVVVLLYSYNTQMISVV